MAVLTRSKSTVYGLETSLTTLQTNIDNEATARSTKDTALQTEVDASQVGAGLATDGAYVVNGASNYIAAAVSLGDADVKLDAAIKAADDRAKDAEGALSGLTTTAKSNIVASINEVVASLAAEVSTLEGADAAIEGRLDVIEGDASTVGSIAKALADANSYADSLNASASSDITTIEGRLDIIEGDSTVEGSMAKAISDVINAAPEALNTLKEIADYINVDPDTDVLSAITNKITDAKNELKGSVTAAFDTLEEVEDAINVLNGDVSTVGSVAKAVADAKSDIEAAATTEHNARVAEEGRIEGLLDDEIADRESEVTRLEGLITAEETRAIAAEGTKLVKANNLSDLTNVATARTNLGVYSKSEVDSAITVGGAIFYTEGLSVAADKITLTHTPKNGMIFNFATVRHTDDLFVSYDIPVTLVSGKEYQLHPNTTGQFDGKAVTVQYPYTAE
jgi:hypothetical protein